MMATVCGVCYQKAVEVVKRTCTVSLRPKQIKKTQPDNYPKPTRKIIDACWATGLSAILRGSCWPAWMSSVELLPKCSSVFVLPSIIWWKAMISGFCHWLQFLTLMPAELMCSKIVHVQWHGDCLLLYWVKLPHGTMGMAAIHLRLNGCRYGNCFSWGKETVNDLRPSSVLL